MGSDGADALRHLDAILAQEPKADQHLFSACTAALARLRNSMIEAPASGTALPRVNAVISVVLAGHFPLGAVPWEELRKTRAWLADIVGGPG